MFGTQEVGSLSENLILNTAGKVKIRYGQKYIDLLNEKGELNVKQTSDIIKKIKSEKEIKQNGFYYYEDTLYAYIDGVKLIISKEPLISILNSELKKPEEENIALVYKDKKWNYIQVVSKEDYDSLEKIVKQLELKIEQLQNN